MRSCDNNNNKSYSIISFTQLQLRVNQEGREGGVNDTRLVPYCTALQTSYLHEGHSFGRCVGDQLRYGCGDELGEAELHLSGQPVYIHISNQPTNHDGRTVKSQHSLTH